MSRIKNFQRVTNFLKLNRRFYCNDKPPKTIKVDVEKLIGENQTKDSSEECAKFEEHIVKQVLLEKEQDANLHSRLAKECKILFNQSTDQLSKTRLNPIRLDEMALPRKGNSNIQSEDLNINYLTNNLTITEKTIDDLPKSTEASTNKAGSDKGGSKQSGNRPIRQEPGKVLLKFIPEEWWYALMPKTGVTGLGTFMFTFGTYMVSKEYYVLEHYYYNGLSSFILWACAIKYIGPKLAQYIDKELDAYETSWNEGRTKQKQMLSESVLDELHLQFQMEGQQMIMDVKRENVHLQLEEEYRKRQMYVYNEVKKRLDYHVAVELIKQRMQHRNLIEYVTNEVVKSITPEMQDKLIYYSIDQIVQDLGEDKKGK